MFTFTNFTTVVPEQMCFCYEYSRLVNDRSKKDDFGYGSSGDQCEVDIAVDALNPEVVFSKTKAFEVIIFIHLRLFSPIETF